MSVFADIKDLNRNHLAVTVCLIASTIGVGTLTLFHFQRALFLSLDWFRILLLVVSLPLPSLLANCVCWGSIAHDILLTQGKDVGERGMMHGFILASLWTTFSYAICLLIAYAFAAKFIVFAALLLVSHLASLLIMQIFDRQTKKMRDAKKRAAPVAQTAQQS